MTKSQVVNEARLYLRPSDIILRNLVRVVLRKCFYEVEVDQENNKT